jgi:hypothetical protein
MSMHIEIRDEVDENYLSVGLNELLKVIYNYGKELKWSLYELDATVKPGGIQGYLEIVQNIDGSPKGYSIPWEKLMYISERLEQVINITLVGVRSDKDLLTYATPESWRRQFPICIEIIDGEYWEVYSESEECVYKLESTYKDTKIRSYK